MILALLLGLSRAEEAEDWEARAAAEGLADVARLVLGRIDAGPVERVRMELAAEGFGRIRMPLTTFEPERFAGLTDASGCSWSGGIQCEFGLGLGASAELSRVVVRCIDAAGDVIGRPVGTEVIGGRGAIRMAVTELEHCWLAGGVRLRLSERPPAPEPQSPPAADEGEPALPWLRDALHASHRRVAGPRVPPSRRGLLANAFRPGRIRYGPLVVGYASDIEGIVSGLDTHAVALEDCLERQLEADDELTFSVELGFTIGRSGTVRMPRVRDLRVDGDRRAQELARQTVRCALASFHMLNFSAGRYAFATVRQQVLFDTRTP